MRGAHLYIKTLPDNIEPPDNIEYSMRGAHLYIEPLPDNIG
jgi:hypothetical protein